MKSYLKQFGLDGKMKEFAQSSATVELAAKAAGVEPGKIAKTLSFKVENNAILIVAAGDARIDNKKYKERFGIKAKMLTPEEVVAFTGHHIGGVCPFDVKEESVKTYLDESLRRFDVVLPAAGSDNNCVVLTLEELERASKSEGWVDVCKL